MGTQPVQLSDILPVGIFVGVSLILPRSDHFLFGIREPKNFGDQLVLEITGIGGGREPDDKTLVDAARREALEEICSAITLVDSPETLLINNQNSITPVNLTGADRPIAVVYRNYRTPPHQPWSKDHLGETCLVIYLAGISDQPSPCGELPWLILLNSNQILSLARNDIPLEELLVSGAFIITGANSPPDPDSLVRLTDSQEALALALGDKTSAFYENAKKLI